MNVLILSDTHGHIHPDILALAKESELAIHCGDIGNAEVLKQIKSITKLIAVRGNNDVEPLWSEEDHPALVTIPWQTTVKLPGGTLGLCHGHQEPRVAKRHAFLRSQFSDCKAVAYGHSHLLTIDATDPDHQVLNPGAAGKARTNGGPSCLVLKATEKNWVVKSHRFSW